MASKEEKDSDPDMDIEEDLIGATGGITDEEMGMIRTLRTLGFQPKDGSFDDIVRLTKMFGAIKKASKDEDDERGRQEQTAKPGLHHYPKFSIFFGETGKGEVSWETFKYEIEAVRIGYVFTQEQILFGIRRSVKGSAGDKIRRLGPGVTLNHVLDKLESAYGTVETKESVLKKFYTCEQKENESVESFASRLEELFDQGVQLGGFKRKDTAILKQVLHSGLKKDLKHMSMYQCDKIREYDEFKREVRKIEADITSDSMESKKPCKPVVQTEKKEETSEVKELLKKINERIDKLEKNKDQTPSTEQVNPASGQKKRWRGRNRWRSGNRGRGQGQQNSNSQRPTVDEIFAPVCFICNTKGHIQRNCPKILAQFVCTACKQKGHFSKDCPTRKCSYCGIRCEHFSQRSQISSSW